jgi:hypothetical protein
MPGLIFGSSRITDIDRWRWELGSAGGGAPAQPHRGSRPLRGASKPPARYRGLEPEGHLPQAAPAPAGPFRASCQLAAAWPGPGASESQWVAASSVAQLGSSKTVAGEPPHASDLSLRAPATAAAASVPAIISDCGGASRWVHPLRGVALASALGAGEGFTRLAPRLGGPWLLWRTLPRRTFKLTGPTEVHACIRGTINGSGTAH